MRKFLLAIWASTTLLPAVTLQAAQEIETVAVIASRTEQPLSAISNSVSVIGAQQLKLIDAVHVSEALHRVPGAWISRGNGQEHLTAIRSPVLTGPGSCGAFYMA
ncbi:MAG: TonB-dependent receptor, partial [Halieaceae bacterium]|nr:TonB-dependent receptor [Halieaceae bacterium]